MTPVVIKLFARQGTRRKTDGQSGDYMFPPFGSMKRDLDTANSVSAKVMMFITDRP